MTGPKQPRYVFEILRKGNGCCFKLGYYKKSIGEDIEKLEPLEIADRMKNDTATYKKSLAA